MPWKPPVLNAQSAPRYDDHRPWRAWYRTQAWRRKAAAQLEREPLCRLCLAQGLVEAAKVADHVIDHKGDRRAFWEGELQSLCVHHHNSKSRLGQVEERTGKPQLQRGCDARGHPLDPAHFWNRGD